MNLFFLAVCIFSHDELLCSLNAQTALIERKVFHRASPRWALLSECNTKNFGVGFRAAQRWRFRPGKNKLAQKVSVNVDVPDESPSGVDWGHILPRPGLR